MTPRQQDDRATAIYSRVSTDRQTSASQDAELKRWIASQDIAAAWYKDKASGKTMERPGMDRLLADVAAGKIGRIVVWRLDRLGRTAAGLTKLFADLQTRRVALISLRDSFDLSTPSGRLMAHVLASVAAYETEVRAEGQRAGIAAAKAAGKTWGGSEKGRRLSVTDEQISVVRELRERDTPITAIARAVKLSRPTIYKLLAE